MASGDIAIYYEGGAWTPKVEGSTRATHHRGTKAEQHAVGRQMARDRGVEHTVSQPRRHDCRQERLRQRSAFSVEFLRLSTAHTSSFDAAQTEDAVPSSGRINLWGNIILVLVCANAPI